MADSTSLRGAVNRPQSSPPDGGEYLVEVGVVAGELLVIGVEQLVAGADDECGPELERAAPRLLLDVPSGQRARRSHHGPRPDHARQPELAGADDLGGGAIFVEQYLEGNPLVLDERQRVALASRADGGDARTCGQDLVIPVADLTGPLAARQSTEVPKEEDHPRILLPSVAQMLGAAMRVDERVTAERRHVEGHESPGMTWRANSSSPEVS